MRPSITLRHPLTFAVALCFLVQTLATGFGLATDGWPTTDMGRRIIAHSLCGAVLSGSCRVAQLRTGHHAGHAIPALAAKGSAFCPQLASAALDCRERATFWLSADRTPRSGRSPPYTTL
jgi:hypothetical protein